MFKARNVCNSLEIIDQLEREISLLKEAVSYMERLKRVVVTVNGEDHICRSYDLCDGALILNKEDDTVITMPNATTFVAREYMPYG